MEEQMPHQRAAISAAASGSAASRAGLAPGSHTEAVLTLAWNRVHRQLLASGSADHTVKLWDMRRGSPIHTWSHHAALVQSVAWHPSVGAESSVLASGSADGTVAVIDARAATGAVLRMPTGAEVEALAWNPHDASSLFVTTQAGVLMALDVRKPTAPVLSLQACKGECASLSVAPRIPGIVATGGSDGVARIWDVSAGPGSATSVGSVGRAVASKAMAVGPLFSAHWLPHADGILAGAGGNGLVAIWDIPNDDARATAALKPRLIPVEAVPSLAVRRRENGQPLTGATTAASATAASSGVVTAAPKTASSASSSSAADGGLMAETSAAIADARRHGAAIEAARAQAARSGVAAGAAGSADFGAMMEAAASSSSSAATVEGGKSKGGKGKGRKGKVVRKAKHK
jgi:periodic tryptophan protein 1